MNEKTWSEKIATLIAIIAGICTILGVSVFDNKSIIKNTKENTTFDKSTECNNYNDKQSANKTIKEEKTTEYTHNYILNIDKNTFVKITGETLSVRSDPSTDAEVILLADRGETFLLAETIIYNEQFMWYKIFIDENETGYVSSKYAEIITKND